MTLAIEHDVLITDGDREGTVLHQVEVLASQRRNDQAQRLRQYDQAQHQSTREAERGAGFPLAARDALDAAAHDFGDVGAGVDRQAGQQRGVFGADG